MAPKSGHKRSANPPPLQMRTTMTQRPSAWKLRMRDRIGDSNTPYYYFFVFYFSGNVQKKQKFITIDTVGSSSRYSPYHS